MNDREVGIIISKLDALHEDIQEIKHQTHDNENRIQSLETFKSVCNRVGAICVVGITTFGGWFIGGK